MTNVAALFVDSEGIYPELLGAERCWGEERDARTYSGVDPVVAHPPCNLWCRLAPSVFARTGKEEHRPAWLGGDDGGCFASALANVRRCGGVLEHPAGSHAWAAHGLQAPNAYLPCWEPYRHPLRQLFGCDPLEWVCEVWQSAYGHAARKRTWLYYVGKRPPFELNWAREPGTHIVSQSSRRVPSGKPRLTATQNRATPRTFAETLIRLAEFSNGC